MGKLLLIKYVRSWDGWSEIENFIYICTRLFVKHFNFYFMSFKKFLVIPLIIAILAFLIYVIDQVLFHVMPSDVPGFCWIAFQAWAVYFLAGCTIQGGIKSLVGYAIGIVASILIMVLAGNAFVCLGPTFSVALSVGIVAFLLICLEKTPWWSSFIPAMFIGAGAFFAFKGNIDPTNSYINIAITEMVYCVLGLTFGYITVTLRALYEKKVGK